MNSFIGKTFLALLILIASSFSTQASGLRSSLEIHANDNRPFIIEVNQQRYNANGSFYLNRVRPGKVRVKILRRNRGNNYNSCGNNRNSLQVMYNGFIDVPSRSAVTAVVSRNRGVRVTDVRRLHHQNQGSCGYNQNDPHHISGSYSLEGHYGGATGSYSAVSMSNHELRNAIDRIRRADFSSDQLRIAKRIIDNNNISSFQLMKMVRELDFDCDKLELAKHGYHSVIDKENIWRVNDAFSFSNTAREFERFIDRC